MPGMVGILKFISRNNFMLISALKEKTLSYTVKFRYYDHLKLRHLIY